MNKFGLLFLGALLGSTSLVAATGCSDDNTGGSGGAGATGGSGGAAGTGGAAGMGGMGGAGGAAAFDCNAYCTDIMANCAGADQQYADMGSCMGACANLPSDGMAGATSGNTMQCRAYHTSAAKMAPAMHCVHAGPSGAGVCGTICESFCALATATCATEWPDAAACATACAAWTPAGMPYNNTFTSGDTTECRLYHLSVAATDAAAATMHCMHTTDISAVCQ